MKKWPKTIKSWSKNDQEIVKNYQKMLKIWSKDENNDQNLIKTGQTITEELIDIRRPGTGIQPIHFDSIIGKKAKLDIPKEKPLTFDMIE